MKKLLVAATAIAALSAPAFAQDTQSVQTQQFQINGDNPAKCQINADDTLVTLEDDSISNDQGRARANVGQRVAQGLNGLGARAWCTGASNTINLTRTPLRTGNGLPLNGFNQSVIYDVAVEIEDANRTDGFHPIEGTEDGPGAGPTGVSQFGPDGRGSRLRFQTWDQPSHATQATAGENPRSFYPEDTSRLTAGDYAGTVTLTITPGN